MKRRRKEIRDELIALSADNERAELQKIWDAIRKNSKAVALISKDISWIRWILSAIIVLLCAIIGLMAVI